MFIVTEYAALSPSTAYNPFLVYCRELAPSAVSLTGDWAQGDDSKHDSHNSLCMHHLVLKQEISIATT